MWDTSHLYVRHNSFSRLKYLIFPPILRFTFFCNNLSQHIHMWDTSHLYVRHNSFSRLSSDSPFSCARRNVCLLNPRSNLRYIFFSVSMFTNILLPDFFFFQIRDGTFRHWILSAISGILLFSFPCLQIHYYQISFFSNTRPNVCSLNPFHNFRFCQRIESSQQSQVFSPVVLMSTDTLLSDSNSFVWGGFTFLLGFDVIRVH